MIYKEYQNTKNVQLKVKAKVKVKKIFTSSEPTQTFESCEFTATEKYSVPSAL